MFISSVILGELEAFRNEKGLSLSFTSAEREVNCEDSCSSGMFQSCNFGTSECPEVASALVRGILELFDVSFKGKK